MKRLPFRQIHIDFHTSEKIKDIGKDFDKQRFKKALQSAKTDSITVFAKCHHGMFYYYTDKFNQHPYLTRNLLQQMIEVCREMGIRVVAYVSAGLDEAVAREHKDWLFLDYDNRDKAFPDFDKPGYHLMCMNTPYLDLLIEQTKEVVEIFDIDGVFFDILDVRMCYCSHCKQKLLEIGRDINNSRHVLELAESVYKNYYQRINNAVTSIKPDISIFHNSGHIMRGRRDLAFINTHLELESLPTGGWGYDHFPMSARYVQNLGLEYLAMTGKFHNTWGEFGGFKHPNALIYETALSIAMGAKCSVGDQLHPSGEMDAATCSLIGKAYERVAKREQWCDNVESVADIGLLSQEAALADGKNQGDIGANRILLEGKYLYDILDLQCDFSKYKLIILPDKIQIDSNLQEKLSCFIAGGGKLLASGISGTKAGRFAFDFGADFNGENENYPNYFTPDFDIEVLGRSQFIMYGKSYMLKKAIGKPLGFAYNSFFNRTAEVFCSHQHAPANIGLGSFPAVTEGKDGIYIGWEIFDDYAQNGAYVQKQAVIYLIDRLLGNNKTLKTNLPAAGVATLMHQKEENRYVTHLLYAAPFKKGKVEVIEDIVPLYDIDLAVKLPQKVKKVYLAPEKNEINFKQENGIVQFKVNKMWCHQIAVLEY